MTEPLEIRIAQENGKYRVMRSDHQYRFECEFYSPLTVFRYVHALRKHHPDAKIHIVKARDCKLDRLLREHEKPNLNYD